MDDRTNALANYGLDVLAILERSEDWSADTLDALADAARERGLASRSSGHFARDLVSLYRNAAGGHYDHDDGCECKLCELFRECASNAGPACGHSACSQNYIETGDRMCIADTDDTEPKGY